MYIEVVTIAFVPVIRRYCCSQRVKVTFIVAPNKPGNIWYEFEKGHDRAVISYWLVKAMISFLRSIRSMSEELLSVKCVDGSG